MLPLFWLGSIQCFALNIPDLTVDDDRLLSSMGTNKLNGRTVVEFSANVLNIGTGPFPTMENAQIFAFSLLNATDETPIVGVNTSNPTFCIKDSFCNEATLFPFTCSNQGISSNCGAECTSNSDCQWFDITDLPLGPYILRAEANPLHSGNETNFDNNIVDIHFDSNTLPSFVPPVGVVIAVIVGGICVCISLCACLWFCVRNDKGAIGYMVGIATTKSNRGGSISAMNRRKYMPGKLRPEDINW